MVKVSTHTSMTHHYRSLPDVIATPREQLRKEGGIVARRRPNGRMRLPGTKGVVNNLLSVGLSSMSPNPLLT